MERARSDLRIVNVCNQSLLAKELIFRLDFWGGGGDAHVVWAFEHMFPNELKMKVLGPTSLERTIARPDPFGHLSALGLVF
jgi:hypothetical protein